MSRNALSLAKLCINQRSEKSDKKTQREQKDIFQKLNSSVKLNLFPLVCPCYECVFCCVSWTNYPKTQHAPRKMPNKMNFNVAWVKKKSKFVKQTKHVGGHLIGLHASLPWVCVWCVRCINYLKFTNKLLACKRGGHSACLFLSCLVFPVFCNRTTELRLIL